MAGGAGTSSFVTGHSAEQDKILLEHAANEVIQQDGKLIATGEPEPQWLFTSRIAGLETTVSDLLKKNT